MKRRNAFIISSIGFLSAFDEIRKYKSWFYHFNLHEINKVLETYDTIPFPINLSNHFLYFLALGLES